MKNKRGYTVKDRIRQDIEYAGGMEKESDRALLATKALGAADLAVEFGLITYNEWEQFVSMIFEIM